LDAIRSPKKGMRARVREEMQSREAIKPPVRSLVKIDEFPYSATAENRCRRKHSIRFEHPTVEWSEMECAKFQLSFIADIPLANKYLSTVNDNYLLCPLRL